MTRLLAPLIAAVFAVAIVAPAQTVPNGGAAGGDAIYLNNGDLIGVRNIQGGTVTDPNLDIGAGSTQTPGDMSFQWDIGTGRVLFYDGHKQLVAAFGPHAIRFYRRVQFAPGQFKRQLWRWRAHLRSTPQPTKGR